MITFHLNDYILKWATLDKIHTFQQNIQLSAAW